MTIYANPGTEGAVAHYKKRYDNYIGGQWVPPVHGEYLDNVTPVTGEVFCQVARGKAEDIEKALDAAHAAAEAWGKTSPAERALMLHRIADRMEEHLEEIAVAETWENGKAVRETLAADIPLAIDHFRYFAGAIRAQESRTSQIDHNTVAYHFHEPIGVVGQIIPWNFPLLMAAWKIAPALAAGNAIVLKPAEQTPASILYWIDIVGDLIPDGVLNIVNGLGEEAGVALSSSNRIGKIAFTGSTQVGKLINRAAADKIIPVTLELGGKSPSIFFGDVMDYEDPFRDKFVEGLAMFALNQGEVCTCPSRALVHESIAEEFLALGVERVRKIKLGNPLDTETMMGAQASMEQMDKISGYLEIGPKEGAEVLAGGHVNRIEGLENGYYIEPTIFKGTNDMRIFQEEIFGPVLSVATFSDFDEAIRIANDTNYGLGAGVWTRHQNTAYRAGRAIQAGRVWVNQYHNYPAHAAFGGYKESGIGRETHLMMLDHYQQTKNLLVSYDENPTGLF
ncbi:aldehyde dehydrogenase [Corynebacterium pseudotuberculosis]|uniref:acetaldehyde dehydrogenase ExaC n=1 Tax=Corynebacterium pseudotuberculosis TaxID=1719 RepID=UPI00025936F1|nr:aldehyde dehydrogenase family protein [Corynebacterium pseudotuberculosis]AFH91683.1 aldehyde dehydrogenase family protein [Corynebacterium pseudotuberculosis 31]APB11674.1 aldehyde dehydrogenase [Corynebacterium pseudotuberculosis]APB13718.1 aldehyde dehydrogenase [Corynebacterium pseudotuberculosis]APB15761.1 aldehyde dehydrogenase [Corynebacterium pseudotuberculosis]APB17806.1 aldehyde dehydrogenase [Corynebacterium pseudotuberculosis]